MAPRLCVLGKWLKPLYNHGGEEKREVEISNQCQEMAFQSTKKDSSPHLLHAPHSFSTWRQPRLLPDPEEATPGSGPSRTSEKPLAHLLRPKPNHTHRWFQGAYEPQRNASVLLYAQVAYEHLVVQSASSSWAAQICFHHWEGAALWVFAQQLPRYMPTNSS